MEVRRIFSSLHRRNHRKNTTRKNHKKLICSLTCYKSHKDSCTNINETPKLLNNNDNSMKHMPPPLQFTEEENEKDRVKFETLQKLGGSTKLKELLHNRNLKDLLSEIDSSDSPNKLLENAMQVPIFTEFVDECLKIVEPDAIDILQVKENKEIQHIKELLTSQEFEDGEII